MKDKVQNIIITVVFLVFILGVSLACILSPEVKNSESERRQLATFPSEITWNKVKNGVLFDEFDDYATDQFPARDFFRSVKARFQMSVLRLKENNGLAIEDGYIAKIENNFNEKSVKYALDRFTQIYETYLKDKNTNNFVSIVPDKNYFFAEKYGYPSPDYDALVKAITEGLSDFEYIDIFDSLELEDYYKTDTHWSQDKIGDAVKKIAQDMGCYKHLSGEYTANMIQNFHGVYYGQSALDPDTDTIVYLTNDTLNKCTVYDYETNKRLPIYDLSKAESQDPYEIFLSGTKALLRIDNPNAKTDKELIVFRDSYGSSLIPLLAEGYKSITIIDIRYVSIKYIGNFISFNDQDVLFLYSTLILNNSFAFKD